MDRKKPSCIKEADKEKEEKRMKEQLKGCCGKKPKKGIRTFFRSKKRIQKVVWPSRKQVIAIRS